MSERSAERPLQSNVVDIAVDELSHLAEPMEALRRKATAWGRSLLFGAMAVSALAGVLWFQSRGLAIGVGAGSLIALLVVYFVTVGRWKDQRRTHYKHSVVPTVVGLLQPDVRFVPDQGISENDFEYPNLFGQSADRYKSEDAFHGRLGETDVHFAECKAESKHRDSEGRTTYRTFFDGLFFVADFHKHFRGKMVVRPDAAEKVLGRIGKALQGFRPLTKDELIYFEDPEFEKHFVVYGTDQVEARYLLSTAMLDRILQLRAKWKDNIWLGFVGSKVYIAIAHDRDLFEPAGDSCAVSRPEIERLIDEMQTCFSLVDDLGLNVRIWSKE